jgi:DNA-binding MarR family transcriptional regulator/ribosomal protein S18 acetylase RimI-like enzyme
MGRFAKAARPERGKAVPFPARRPREILDSVKYRGEPGAMTRPSPAASRVANVRRFNRFYTRQIGVLRERLHDSPFSLTAARILYELAHRQRPNAAALGKDLGLDAGYLSRILRRFERRGLIARTRSRRDGRRSHLDLTTLGRREFAPLDRAARREVAAMLKPLGEAERQRLVDAMRAIEHILEPRGAAEPAFRIRPHRPGDLGWIVAEHGRLYAEEYGWDGSFEGFVAEIAARFIRDYDAAGDGCWLAERNGEILGSIMLVRQSARTAKLRVFLVKPEARGLGVGKALIAQCLRFARDAGYRKVSLWTQSGLDAARHLYESAGFKLIREEPHHSWGRDHIGQYWELKL